MESVFGAPGAHKIAVHDRAGVEGLPEDIVHAGEELFEESQVQLKAGAARLKAGFREAQHVLEEGHVMEQGKAELGKLHETAKKEGLLAAAKEAGADALDYVTASEKRMLRLERGLMGILKLSAAMLFGYYFFVKMQVAMGFVGVVAALIALASGQGVKESAKIFKDIGLAPLKLLVGLLKSALDDFEGAYKGVSSPKELKAKYDGMVASMDALEGQKVAGTWSYRAEKGVLGIAKGLVASGIISVPWLLTQIVYALVGGAVAAKAWRAGKDTSYGKGIAAAPLVWAGALCTSIKNDFVKAYSG